MRLKKSKDEIRQELLDSIRWSLGSEYVFNSHNNYENHEIYYTDQWGNPTRETISIPKEVAGMHPQVLEYIHRLCYVTLSTMLDNLYTNEEFEKDIGLRDS